MATYNWLDHSIAQSPMNFKCPICGKPTAKATHPDFPFCSERCRALDLGNWAAERYVVSEPVIDEDELDDDAPPASQENGNS